MSSVSPPSFLRRVLLIDAVCSASMAAAMLLLTSTLSSLLRLPADLLRDAGFVLIPFAVFVGYLATHKTPSRIGVWAVIVMNVFWAVDSILLLLTGWIDPNAWGYALIVVQAVVVAVFGKLQYWGLQGSRTSAPASSPCEG